MNPIVGAGLISAGGSLLSGLTGSISANATNKANAREAALNRQFQHNEAELSYQRQVEQWQREAEYSDPANQMARYAAAGLNPNLIYNQQQNSPSSSSAPQAGSVGNPQMRSADLSSSVQSAFQNFMSLRRMGMEQEELNQNIEFRKAEIEKLNAETDGIINENTFNKMTAAVRAAILQSNLSNSQKDSILKDLEASFKGEQIKALTYQNNFTADTYNDRLAQTGLQTMLMQADIAARRAAANQSNADAASKVYDIHFRKSIESYLQKSAKAAASLSLTEAKFARASYPYRLHSSYIDMLRGHNTAVFEKASLPVQLKILNHQLALASNDLIRSNLETGFALGAADGKIPNRLKLNLFGNPYSSGFHGIGSSLLPALMGYGLYKAGKNTAAPIKLYEPTASESLFFNRYHDLYRNH